LQLMQARMAGVIRVNLFSAKNVGWISVAHPPCQLKKVDALRLSTLLLLFDCTRFIKNQSSLIFRTNLQGQIYLAGVIIWPVRGRLEMQAVPW